MSLKSISVKPHSIGCVSLGRRRPCSLPRAFQLPAKGHEQFHGSVACSAHRPAIVCAAKSGQRRIEVENPANQKYFRAVVVSYLSDVIQVEDIEENESFDKLYKGLIKSTAKQMKLFLAKPSQIGSDPIESELELNVLLFTGALEVWMRRIGGHNLTKAKYERGAYRLAKNALNYINQNLHHVKPLPNLRDIPEGDVVVTLKPLLVDLVRSYKPNWDTTRLHGTGEKVFDGMLKHLMLVWKHPKQIGTVDAKDMSASVLTVTDAQRNVFSQIQKIVMDAGKDTKSIGSDEIETEALYLTSIACSMCEQL